MSSNGVRTASLAIPTTQNTGTILEFSCLFTNDLKQKKKRWQDGFLRFHTFNKRIMLYDIPRNYIGDTHWREEQAVQDGDELKLDRGVLVQVGEAQGSMEQDLTELLEKRRPGQGSSPARNAASRSGYIRPSGTHATPRLPDHTAVGSVRGSHTQLQPKSLNAVLGVPQGAYGRAMLPIKSPYAQRQIVAPTGHENVRPAKRICLDSDSLNLRALPPIAPAQSSLALSPPRPVVRRVPKQIRVTPRPQRHNPILIESDDESATPWSPTEDSPVTRAVKAVAHANNGTRSRNIIDPRSKPLMRPNTSVPARDISRMPLSKLPQISNLDDGRPVNKLKIAPSISRKKLMYRSMLSRSGPGKDVSTVDAPEDATQNTRGQASTRSRRRRRGISEENADRPNVVQEHGSPETIDELVPVSVQPDITANAEAINEFPVPDMSFGESLFLTQDIEPIIRSEGVRVVPQSPTPLQDIVPPPPISESSRLPPDQHREDSVLPSTTDTARPRRALLQKSHTTVYNIDSGQAATTRRSLRKATSDLSGLKPQAGAAAARSPLHEAKAMHCDPWSKDEAFDLFGWAEGETKEKVGVDTAMKWGKA